MARLLLRDSSPVRAMARLYRFGAMQTCYLSTNFQASLGRFLRPALLLLFCFLQTAQAGFQTLWEIGSEDNLPKYNFDPRHGLAWPNWRNDPAPGQVTRSPGDPQYSATSNPPSDDDFYLTGFYPAGFNALTND